jgi:hypothetical protein
VTAKKRWAPWKVALLAGGAVGVIGVGLLVALIPARAADFDARMDRGTQGLAQLALIVGVVAYLIQYARTRKQTAPDVARVDATGEPIVAESTGMWIADGNDVRPGRIDLTPRRIVFHQASARTGLAGTVIGILTPKSGGHRALDIELATITRVQRGRFRASGKVLELSLADGRSHRVIVDRYDAFVSHLNARAGDVLVDMANAR